VGPKALLSNLDTGGKGDLNEEELAFEKISCLYVQSPQHRSSTRHSNLTIKAHSFHKLQFHGSCTVFLTVDCKHHS